LLVVGLSRSGKTELSSCARELIGEPVASPCVSEISETFGMQNFIGKSAWIRDDAVNEGDRLDPQRFKVIMTGEPVSIRRMAQQALEARLQIPVMLTANSLPRARDHSDAVYNRSIVLKLNKVMRWVGRQLIPDRDLRAASGASVTWKPSRKVAGMPPTFGRPLLR
jgi:putative DNA primase/helicase